MKRLVYIVFALAAALMVVGSCNRLPRPAATLSQRGIYRTLEGIDSLMWKQPDSALTVMKELAAKVDADSMDAFEGHYCQLLISELLYKNYYEQSNREALLKAVAYFDSLVAEDEADTHKADARGASLQERNAFLDARAHYINGVGFYEKGDVVQACEEYLNALEMMEEHFEVKALTGGKAVFMENAYGRLFELFSAQFMMDPAVACGEQALAYCEKEPILMQYIPVLYYHLGKQYDKKGERTVARSFYDWVIEEVLDTNNLLFRDAVSAKALCDYQLGKGADSSLITLRQMLAYANGEKEKLTRFLAIGCIFTVEQSFDSALCYLNPVFESDDDVSMQIQAAEYLLVNYDKFGNKEKLDECVRFLAGHKKTEGETKALVSKLEDLFKDYMNQKQKKEAEAERKRSIENAVKIIVPIAVAVALVILVVAKLRGRKKLKQQRAEADRMLGEKELQHEEELRLRQVEADKTLEETVKKHEEELKRQQAETERLLEEAERKHQLKVEDMVKRHEAELRIQKDQSEKEIEQTRQRHKAELETERLAYQKEREELQLSLQLSKRNVNSLQEELGRKRTDAEGHYEAFLKEPVCVKINDAVRDLEITTRKSYTSYRVSFDDETLAQFGLVVSE